MLLENTYYDHLCWKNIYTYYGHLCSKKNTIIMTICTGKTDIIIMTSMLENFCTYHDHFIQLFFLAQMIIKITLSFTGINGHDNCIFLLSTNDYNNYNCFSSANDQFSSVCGNPLFILICAFSMIFLRQFAAVAGCIDLLRVD